THAPEQLPFIVTDTAPAAILHDTRLGDLLAEIAPDGTPTIALDAAKGVTPTRTDWPKSSGRDAAYVMYTSGTTGTPKGVIAPQCGIAAHALDQPLRPVSPEDVMLHAATIAADGSSGEIWGALLNGAALAIVEAEKPGLADIAHVMTTRQTTTAIFYAGLLHLMVDHHIDAFASMRVL
ncbi:MAG: AMP-binding protein, partial [Microthrixaceae bacterium]|nr:AMP-binding protein [Microthrixaceae bacterium]